MIDQLPTTGDTPGRTVLGGVPYDNVLLQDLLSHLDDLLGPFTPFPSTKPGPDPHQDHTPPPLSGPPQIEEFTAPDLPSITGQNQATDHSAGAINLGQCLPELKPPNTEHHNPAHEAFDMEVRATIFIGMHRGGQYSVSAVRPNIILDDPTHAGDVLELLMQSPHFPGRALSKFPVNDRIWVGTSRRPIDIETGQHQSHVNQFREIGTLSEILDDPTPAMRASDILLPAEDCAERTHLLVREDRPLHEPVFVLYVYDEVNSLQFYCETLFMVQHLQVESTAPASGVPSTAPAPQGASALGSSTVFSVVDPSSYLVERFGPQKSVLREMVLNTSYGAAYRQALYERGVRTLAETIGITWSLEGAISPVLVAPTLTITLTDLLNWLEVGKASTFKNVCKMMRDCRTAMETLREWVQTGSSKSEDGDLEKLEILLTLVTADIIQAPDLSAQWNLTSGQRKAITMTKVSLENLVNGIIERS